MVEFICAATYFSDQFPLIVSGASQIQQGADTYGEDDQGEDGGRLLEDERNALEDENNLEEEKEASFAFQIPLSTKTQEEIMEAEPSRSAAASDVSTPTITMLALAAGVMLV